MAKPFNLTELGEDLLPILQKHELTGIVGITFDEGEGLHTFKFVDPAYPKTVTECNAVFRALDDILKIARCQCSKEWDNVPIGGSKEG